jgi:nucleoside-diphosphate-sugar epimerase
VNQLLNILKNIMGSKVLPIYQEPRKGDVRDSLADIQKVRQILNYEPQVEIEAGLKKTVEYFQRLRAPLPANKG